MDLKQTKGTATFKGKIFGLEREDAVKTNDKGTMTKLNLRLATDVDNQHFIGVTFFPNSEFVGLWVNDPNDKDKGCYVKIPIEDAYERDMDTLKDIILDDMENEERLEEKGINLDDVEPENISIMGVTAVKGSEDESTNYVLSEDAIEDIQSKFKDGDSVVVVLEKTTNGSDRAYHSYEIKKIFSSNEEIDFEDDGFEEYAELKDTFVFSSISIKSKEKKAYVEGYSISYSNMPVQVVYEINWNEFEDDKAVADSLKKNAKFGDLITADCEVHNRVTYKEVSENKKHVGRKNRSSKGKREIDTEYRALQIIGIEINKGYKKDELFPEDDM